MKSAGEEKPSKAVNRKKKSRNVKITFQLDGTGPPVRFDRLTRSILSHLIEFFRVLTMEDEDEDNDIEGVGAVASTGDRCERKLAI